MDFKVAGTAKGITALQMDLKIKGISEAVMGEALEQARVARLKILEVMKAAISEPRKQLSPYAPRMLVTKIDVDKIGTLIGPGGKNVRSLQEKYGVKIDIQEDGTVYIASEVGANAEKALEAVHAITEEAVLGSIYTGRVTRVEPYGAFVEFLPNKEGLVHISQLSDRRIENIEDEVSVGDELMVMVTAIDPTGRVRLSRQAVLEGWTLEEARERDRGLRLSSSGSHLSSSGSSGRLSSSGSGRPSSSGGSGGSSGRLSSGGSSGRPSSSGSSGRLSSSGSGRPSSSGRGSGKR